MAHRLLLTLTLAPGLVLSGHFFVPSPSPSSSFFSFPSSQPPARSSVSDAVANGRIPIVTTIFPLQEFARAVAGDRGEVSLLLPPGAGIHTWQPRASDMLRLHRARLFICVGAGLEPWVEDILRSLPAPGPEILSAAEFLPLIEDEDKEAHAGHQGREGQQEEHGGSHETHGDHALDPHVWLDFDLAQRIVSRIAETLARVDPAGAQAYAANAASYNLRLEELDRTFEAGLARCRHRTVLLAGHAAFGYLTRKYGLEQVSLYGLSPDAEPTPGRMMSAVRKARELGVQTVFVEANMSTRMARALAREIGAELLVLNPGASPTRGQLSSGATFFDIMEENLRAIRKGLGCE